MIDRKSAIIGLVAATLAFVVSQPPQPVHTEVTPTPSAQPDRFSNSGGGKNSENDNRGLRESEPTIDTGNADASIQVNP